MKHPNLTEGIQIGLYIIMQGEFFFANCHLAKILGYENTAQIIGKSFWSIVHPDDVANVSFRPENEIISQHHKKHGFRVIKPDGRTIWVRMKGKNIYYDGKPANIGHLTDITHYRKIEKKVEKYCMIIDEVEDAVAEANLSGDITFLNASGAKRFSKGVPNVRCDRIESYLLKNRNNFRSYVDEKSSKIVKSAYHKVYQTGIPNKNITYDITTLDGRVITVEDSVALIRDEDEKIIGFRTVSRDISSRIAAEKKITEHRTRLEAIFRSVNDAIITIDPDFKVIEANAAIKTICGADPYKILGKKFPGCIECCDKSCTSILRKILSEKKHTKEEVFECRHNSHSHQIIEANASPLVDPKGRFIGGVLVFKDITKLKHLENQLLSRHQFQNIVGKSQKMGEIYSLLKILSDVETTVLITGNSGTGKELVAKALHYDGRRALKPFITVNCSALAENLLESELFGHVKGAFTGAISNKQGRFHAADGGTIMLDEIGDISPMIQLKLLRVIQEKEFERVGEIKTSKVDVRIIACTNKDLFQMVKKGRFRGDLYYRLKVMEINLPPLSERVEDIPLLVEHFCKLFRKQFKKKITGTSKDAMDRLMYYSWPGNVRELKHVIERAFVLCSGNVISQQQLPAEILNETKTIRRKNHKASLKRYGKSREKILSTLKRVQGNKSKAAKILGISRQTLYRRIEEFKINTNAETYKEI